LGGKRDQKRKGNHNPSAKRRTVDFLEGRRNRPLRREEKGAERERRRKGREAIIIAPPCESLPAVGKGEKVQRFVSSQVRRAKFNCSERQEKLAYCCKKKHQAPTVSSERTAGKDRKTVTPFFNRGK